MTRKSKLEDGDQKKERSKFDGFNEARSCKTYSLREKELLQFDFTNVIRYTGETNCNIPW